MTVDQQTFDSLLEIFNSQGGKDEKCIKKSLSYQLGGAESVDWHSSQVKLSMSGCSVSETSQQVQSRLSPSFQQKNKRHFSQRSSVEPHKKTVAAGSCTQSFVQQAKEQHERELKAMQQKQVESAHSRSLRKTVAKANSVVIEGSNPDRMTQPSTKAEE